MTMLTIRASAAACAAAAAALWLTPAYPHAVCGARIFPTTLAIDDPGVTDELTLPAVSWRAEELGRHRGTRHRRRMGEDDLPQLRAFGRLRRDLAARRRLRPGLSRDRSEISVHVHPTTRAHGLSRFQRRVGRERDGLADRRTQHVFAGARCRLGLRRPADSMNLVRPFAITAEASTTTPGQTVWGERCSPPTSTGASRCNTACPIQCECQRDRRPGLSQAYHGDHRIRLPDAGRQCPARRAGHDRDDSARPDLYGGHLADRG